LDYLQAMCVQVSQRWRRVSPEWCGPGPDPQPAPVVPLHQLHSRFCTEDDGAHCLYCQSLIAKELEAKRQSM
jgi:hypothetical protein